MAESSSPADALLQWYEHLSGRTVDLIGDYAGNELFLVEGDSLLLHCLDDRSIDFDDNLQLLHAIYAIESFLSALLQRKSNFHIVFFRNHANLCIPSWVSPKNDFKYQLLRAVAIRHLSENLPKTRPSVIIGEYDSYRDPEFVKYMNKIGLYFVMCHDGASSTLKLAALPDAVADVDDSPPPAGQLNGSEGNLKLAYRSMIFYFVQQGFNIALTNSVEWQDTKIMSMVLEGRRKHGEEYKKAADAVFDSVTPSSAPENVTDLDRLLGELNGDINSEAQCLTFCVLKQLIMKDSSLSDAASALLLQSVMARNTPLNQRRLASTSESKGDDNLLTQFSNLAQHILSSAAWKASMTQRGALCDIADLIDGRLFYQIQQKLSTLKELQIGVEAANQLRTLSEALPINLPKVSGKSLQGPETQSVEKKAKPGSSPGGNVNLMPFSNEVFDRHLSSIHVDVEAVEPEPDVDASRTFRELTHWHNTRPVVMQGKVTLTDWQKARAMRSHHMFMRELTQYAASLTNTVGKALEPEVIFVGQQSAPAIAPSSASAGAAKAENAARLAEKNEKKFLSAWVSQLKDLSQTQDAKQRYIRTQAYLNGLPKDRREFIGIEVELYLLNSLLILWAAICKEGQQKDTSSARFAALIFDLLNRLHKPDTPGLTKTIQNYLQITNDSLDLPFKIVDPSIKYDRPLSFQFLLSKVDKSLSVSTSALEFELEHCGPYVDRSIDSAPDPRVRFEPDAWQSRVLDLIDQKKSAFVVAPTSAGKTFISFYAMKQVLRESDEGILVYVAPTKALVNQIAAELQAQYTKRFKYAGKTVWAIHTRDYRINDPQGCQILVTVPHVLQIMLLAPSHAKPSAWSTRVKRIIFDEIHSIGAAEDGVVWEQLLLLSPCPIIALSATVGNPDEFHDWMRSTQEAMGFEMEKVQHPYRYSDLRKFVYQPPKTFSFQPLATDDTVGLPSLDGTPGLLYLHPVASLINESRGMPDDLHLEPRDCLSLWRCMAKYANEKYTLPDSLDPSKSMPSIVRKVDVIKWESALKALLKEWMGDTSSPFRQVIDELSLPLRSGSHSTSNGTDGQQTNSVSIDSDDLLSTTLPLLSALNSRNALPALLFNYDRTMCEKICQSLMAQLVEHEKVYKANSPKWKKKLSEWADWKKAEEKNKFKRPTAKKSKNKGDDDGASKAELEREAAEMESNPWASFDPEAPLEGFGFSNGKALLPSEFNEIKRRLQWRHVPDWLVDGLRLGIGVHHAGMNRTYRQAVETLFRRGFLKVVVATGTLALGINMPCKTVIFSGDSVFLTALNFRQAAGRAGRRGFDLLGNVVFQNIRQDKVARLVSSRLPDLNGHFPITTSLVLRLFTLLHDSKGSPYAKKAINSLLSQPRLYLGGENFQEQVLHHLRYSIEYLRRQYLIGKDGRPLNFAGTVSHLYYTESSSFAFHCLLKDGFFNKLCANFSLKGKSEERILDTLMLVMAHLFGRRFCRRADQEFVDQVVKRHSSYVFLPKMPADAEKSLRAHNAETLQVFSTYVKTFAEQHSDRLGADRKLPLTEVLVGGEPSTGKANFLESLPPATIRSAFVALSGHGDQFETIAELCRTARSGVWLEEAAIPHVALYPDEAQMPLNAYLYDFFKHGDVVTLEKANGIRRGDVWFLLNDFSLVLATIVTSFKNFMNVSEDADLELVEVAGGGDMHELDEDDRIARVEDAAANGTPKQALPIGQTRVQASQKVQAPAATTQKKKKKVVADSWADEDAESSEPSDWDADDSDGDATVASTKATSVTTTGAPAWDEESGEGLRKVALAFEALKKAFDDKFKKMWA